jgi:hypothetical protein
MRFLFYLAMNCIPESVLSEGLNYEAFLVGRRKLMASKVETYFHSLSLQTLLAAHAK